MIYNSLIDLLRKWGAGTRNIAPSRGRWTMQVVADVLVDGRETLGIPVPGACPRSFWYNVVHFSGSFALREKLEMCGGFPVMPHELQRKMPMGNLKGVGDDVEDDDALHLVVDWFKSAGIVRTLRWRGCLIEANGGGIDLGRVLRGAPRTEHVLGWGGSMAVLHLLGQVRRNPPLLWLRDACYTMVGRMRGLGYLPTNVEVFPKTKRLGEALRIKTVPTWVIKELERGVG